MSGEDGDEKMSNIYGFFKDLTTGKLQQKESMKPHKPHMHRLTLEECLAKREADGKKYKGEQQPEMPFSLFISMERRRRLLDAVMADSNHDRKKGEMILNNYKRQLAERMARERVDDEELMQAVRRSSSITMDTISRRIEAAHRAKVDNTKIVVEDAGTKPNT